MIGRKTDEAHKFTQEGENAMKLKKILAAVLAVMMLAPCLAVNASAADAPVTRAAAVEQLAAALGADTSASSASFTDVPASASYAGAVAWATGNDIVKGTDNGTKFTPNGTLTLEAACTMVARAAAVEGIGLHAGVLTYSDAASVSGWARDAMSKCAAAGLLTGFADKDGRINPKQTVTASGFTRMVNGLRALLPTDSATVHVEGGDYLGTFESGVYRFVGMQYGVVDGRFQSAHKPKPFPGVHTATVYGPSCPSDGESANPGASSPAVTAYMSLNGYYSEGEDCLYVNVWSPTMDTGAKKPVLFFIHGGGFSSGSGNELVFYDGANFARTQDAVFVSINHRLNVLGYTDLSAYGDEYKYSGNAGQEDITLALEWVRDNIEQFGGDPDNVTILGQSGGGGKVAALLGSPRALELFDKAAIFSGGGGTLTRTKKESQAAGKALVEKCKETYELESDEEALETLATLPYHELSALAAGTGVGAGPTIDGDLITASARNPEDETWTDISKDVPLMISYTFSELSSGAGSMANNTIDPAVFYPSMGMGVNAESWQSQNTKSHMSDEYKQSVIEGIYGEDTQAALEIFKKAFPNMEPFDITRMDVNRMREGAHAMAEARAKSGADKTYQCEWTYVYPMMGGMTSMHTNELAFIFQNLDMLGRYVNGDRDNAQRLADASSAALRSFMADGDPSTKDLPWSAYTEDNAAIMIFDSDSGVRVDHDTAMIEMFQKHNSSDNNNNPF